MMKNFKFVISTPEGNLYEGEIVCISLRGADGDLAVMANHTPFVTSVKPCRCRIELDDGTEKACWQIQGTVSDRHFLMYVNTQTGAIEDVQILLESDGGILAV